MRDNCAFIRACVKETVRGGLTRPVVHMVFTRLALGVAASLLAGEFISMDDAVSVSMYAYLFMGALLLVMAWMAYLRIDGLKLPAFDKRLFEWKKWKEWKEWKERDRHTFGDMSDYANEPVKSYDDLEDGERDYCRMVSDALCGILFIILSFA